MLRLRDRIRRALPTALTAVSALALAGPAPASGQDPGVPGAMELRLERAHPLDGQLLVARGQLVRLRGVITPYVPGQVVAVRVNVGYRRVLLAHPPIERVGSRGEFSVELRVPRVGPLKASALHAPTAALGRLAADSPRAVSVMPVAGGGARGPRVRLLQTLLRRMGYSTPVSGYYDDATGRAVLAYRKANVMPRVRFASRRVFVRLADGIGRFPVYYPSHGRHVEADLGRQVLALINPGGQVFRVFHMSSGTPSTPTVRGSFRVYWKQPGTNSKGMVHSNYFIGGYAIHGYKSVPTYPASHGCLRVPIPNARFINRWIRRGTRVDVYYRNRPAPRRPRVNPRPGP